MALVNENFLKLSGNSLDSDIERKVNAYRIRHPETKAISLATGCAPHPPIPAAIKAMHKAVDEMSSAKTFHGYGPEQGYDFLRKAILRNCYAPRGIKLEASEIFVSDGARSIASDLCGIIRWDNTAALMDPISPAYLDICCMEGRAGAIRDGRFSNIIYMPATPKNSFSPSVPAHRADMICLCNPNSATGTAISADTLRKIVSYALKNDAVILYDASYEAFIRDEDVPHSIYEIRGARKCAIEFHSYSMDAGLAGVRCAYAVVPHELMVTTIDGERKGLSMLSRRCLAARACSASYISQRAAEAIYSPEGKEQMRHIIDMYMENASIMLQALEEMGLEVYGGQNAPYLWIRTPGKSSWKFFEELLYATGVVCAPGAGFGPSGEGFARLSAIAQRADCEEAVRRIREYLQK